MIHVYELLKINRIVTNTVFVSNSKRAKNFPHRILKIIYNRIIFSPVLIYLRYRVDHLNLRKLPRVSMINFQVNVAVFDTTRSKLYSNLCAQFSRQPIPTISIPHGPNFAVSAFLKNLQTKNEEVSRTREQCFDI